MGIILVTHVDYVKIILVPKLVMVRTCFKEGLNS